MQNHAIREDEINLLEVFKTIIEHKFIVLSFTFVTTISSMLYVWVSDPVFSGSVLLEVGDVILNSDTSNDKPTIITPIENTINLKEVITQSLIDQNDASNMSIDIPTGSNNLIQLTYESTNKNTIRVKLEQLTETILKRHNEKTKFYAQANAKINPTSIVSKIAIKPHPVRPNVKLILLLSVSTGFLIGIFSAFLRNYFKKSRNKE